MTAKGCKKSTMPQTKLSLRSALGVAAQLLLLSTPVWAMPLIDVAKSSTTIFVGNFESGFSEFKKEACCQHSIQTVGTPVRAGRQAVIFKLKKGDPIVANRPRAELKLGSVPANSEQWIGFSMFLPSDYQKDSVSEVVAQWHDLPDKDLGEQPRRPPLSMGIENGRLHLGRRWDPNPKTGTATDKNKLGPGGGEEELDLGTYQTGKWTDFVFHIKWSYKSDGILEIWKDGQLVLKKLGPNTYNDQKGPYFKFGIYKARFAASNISERTLYFDEVRVGDASASYKDVAPPNSQTPIPQPPIPQPPASEQIISENFSSASTSNFTVELGGSWIIDSGKYSLNATQETKGYANSNISVHKTPLTDNFGLTADASATATSNNWDDFSIVFNYRDHQNYYYASFNESDSYNTNGIFKVKEGVKTQLANFNSLIQPQTTYNIKVEKAGESIKVYRDGNLLATATDSTFSSGKVGFGSFNSSATFDNLQVQ